LRVVTADSQARQPLSCSVIVATIGRPDELALCLEAIAKQDYASFDVIVIDNSRTGDKETAAVAARFGARYVWERQPGLSRARNRGALVSGADIIAYLDDDSIPEAGWLAGMMREFDDPQVMAVGGRTMPLRLETDSERLFAEVRGLAYNRPSRLTVDRNTPSWFDICGFGGIGSGCNMAIRRKAFEVWPGFNERTGRGTPIYGGDEQYAFLSLVSLGFRAAYTPYAIVRHPFPPTMEVLRSRHLRDLTASAAFFTMMLVEEREHRRSSIRYLWEALKGTERTWRGNARRHPPIVSRVRGAAALAFGPFRYLQSLLPDSNG
jgi:glycosyltransferase involved in cell wall biosynthesis